MSKSIVKERSTGDISQTTSLIDAIHDTRQSRAKCAGSAMSNNNCAVPSLTTAAVVSGTTNGEEFAEEANMVSSSRMDDKELRNAQSLPSTIENGHQPAFVRRARRQFTESYHSYQMLLRACDRTTKDDDHTELDLAALENDMEHVRRELSEKRRNAEQRQRAQEDEARRKRQEEAELQEEMDRMIVDHVRYQLVQEFMAVTRSPEARAKEILALTEWDLNKGIAHLAELTRQAALQNQQKSSQINALGNSKVQGTGQAQPQSQQQAQQQQAQQQQLTQQQQQQQRMVQSQNQARANQGAPLQTNKSAVLAQPSAKGQLTKQSTLTQNQPSSQQMAFQKSSTLQDSHSASKTDTKNVPNGNAAANNNAQIQSQPHNTLLSQTKTNTQQTTAAGTRPQTAQPGTAQNGAPAQRTNQQAAGMTAQNGAAARPATAVTNKSPAVSPQPNQVAAQQQKVQQQQQQQQQQLLQQQQQQQQRVNQQQQQQQQQQMKQVSTPPQQSVQQQAQTKQQAQNNNAPAQQQTNMNKSLQATEIGKVSTQGPKSPIGAQNGVQPMLSEQEKRRQQILAAAEKRLEDNKYRGVSKDSIAQLEKRNSVVDRSVSRDRKGK